MTNLTISNTNFELRKRHYYITLCDEKETQIRVIQGSHYHADKHEEGVIALATSLALYALKWPISKSIHPPAHFNMALVWKLFFLITSV